MIFAVLWLSNLFQEEAAIFAQAKIFNQYDIEQFI
jgi:hypothetical protein